MSPFALMIERRNAERRAAFNAAARHHFEQCERRKAQRRASDAAAVDSWVARFDAARASKGRAA